MDRVLRFAISYQVSDTLSIKSWNLEFATMEIVLLSGSDSQRINWYRQRYMTGLWCHFKRSESPSSDTQRFISLQINLSQVPPDLPLTLESQINFEFGAAHITSVPEVFLSRLEPDTSYRTTIQSQTQQKHQDPTSVFIYIALLHDTSRLQEMTVRDDCLSRVNHLISRPDG